MKSICTILVAGSLALPCLGQSAQNVFTASITGGDRLMLVKTSIDIPAWHEKTFWPLYENYVEENSSIANDTYRALRNLAAQHNVTDDEGAQLGEQLLRFRGLELELLKEYYAEIGKELNGLIALQFLQTEAMIDMVENVRIYENSPWKKFKFHPKALKDEKVAFAKRNIITKAMALSAEETDNFWTVYADYEEERDATLGTDYDMVSVFAGEASDFTPALAKRLGYDFLMVMEREQKLKQKYFDRMAERAGASVAARFLAWEDYYSVISKMHAWSEAE